MASTALAPYQTAGRLPARIPRTTRKVITHSVQKPVSFKTPRPRYSIKGKAGMFVRGEGIQYMAGYQSRGTRRIFLGNPSFTKFKMRYPGVVAGGVTAGLMVAGGLVYGGYRAGQAYRARPASQRFSYQVKGKLKASPTVARRKAQRKIQRRPMMRLSGSSTNAVAKRHYARYRKVSGIVKNPGSQRPNGRRLALAATAYAGGRATNAAIKRTTKGGRRRNRTRRDSRGRYAGSY